MIKTLLCAKSSISMISPALYVADNLLKVNVKYFKLVYYGTITGNIMHPNQSCIYTVESCSLPVPVELLQETLLSKMTCYIQVEWNAKLHSSIRSFYMYKHLKNPQNERMNAVITCATNYNEINNMYNSYHAMKMIKVIEIIISAFPQQVM